jgi:hypothetical protein
MAAKPPRASPEEEFAEFAEYARLIPFHEGAGNANNLQDYLDGTVPPSQLCGSILILGEESGGAAGARFARVRTHQGYNNTSQTWRVVVKEGDAAIDVDRQWFHDNVHAAAVGLLHDSAASRTTPSKHTRVRVRGDLARAYLAPRSPEIASPRDQLIYVLARWIPPHYQRFGNGVRRATE